MGSISQAGSGVLTSDSHTPSVCQGKTGISGIWEDAGCETKPGRTGIEDDGFESLRLSEIVERHDDRTKLRLRPRTQAFYQYSFSRFFKTQRLSDLTREQLRRKGKDEILSYLQSLPRRSWQTHLACIRSYWTIALKLEWPINAKVDLPPMPAVRRKQSPNESVVRAWAEKLRYENDEYTRLVWLMAGQYGLRPSHLCRLKWEHVLRDSDGIPIGLHADGSDCGFKTNAPVMAVLFPDVRETLVAWEKKTPYHGPNEWIFPWRSASGIFKHEPTNEKCLWRILIRLRRKWSLPYLTMSECRHYVCVACRKAGLSRVASGNLVGHDTRGQTYRDWYDNPQVEDVLSEQIAVMPDGPLGLITSPKAQLTDDIPQEMLKACVDFLHGNVGEIELAQVFARVRGTLNSQNQNTKVFDKTDFRNLKSIGIGGVLLPESPSVPETQFQTTSISFSCSLLAEFTRTGINPPSVPSTQLHGIEPGELMGFPCPVPSFSSGVSL